MMIRNPTVHIPRWDDHPTASIHPSFAAVSPTGNESLAALQRYLPSNLDPDWDDDLDIPVDAFSCDQFRMFEFKVKRCACARSHDWTECPYAHPGEKARRRDPCKYSYSGSSCPEYRKGGCRKGDLCEFAHGVFECWLHPDRYRTQACKDGTHCRRRVCFFAHTPEQLRIIPGCFDSPKSVLHSPPESPPMSPSEALRMNSVSGLALSMRNLHIAGNMRMGPFTRRPGFTIPTGSFDPPMERVESGRDLRARMYAKLSMDNSVDSASPVPDFGWIAELVN